jgi:hypothetical protein
MQGRLLRCRHRGLIHFEYKCYLGAGSDTESSRLFIARGNLVGHQRAVPVIVYREQVRIDRVALGMSDTLVALQAHLHPSFSLYLSVPPAAEHSSIVDRHADVVGSTPSRLRVAEPAPF